MNQKPFFLSIILFFTLLFSPSTQALNHKKFLIGGSLITSLCAGKLIWNQYYKNQLKKLCLKQHNIVTHATYEVQGSRPTMEDAHCAHITKNYAYFGLFDGHGSQKLAQYAADNLHQSLITNAAFSTNIEQAFDHAFLATHHNFRKTNEGKHAHYGSCALTLLIKDNIIWSANAGDSRTVLSINGTAKRLSYDHKPDEPEEKERIEKNGGFITHGRAYKIAPIVTAANHQTGNLTLEFAPWFTPSRTCGIFALSRALGDYSCENILCQNPYVSKHECTGDEEFIILGCDGLWDIIKDQAAVDIIRHQLLIYKNSKTTKKQIAKEICKHLCNLASGKLNKEVNSHDNVTVTLILFPKAFK